LTYIYIEESIKYHFFSMFCQKNNNDLFSMYKGRNKYWHCICPKSSAL